MTRRRKQTIVLMRLILRWVRIASVSSSVLRCLEPNLDLAALLLVRLHRHHLAHNKNAKASWSSQPRKVPSAPISTSSECAPQHALTSHHHAQRSYARPHELAAAARWLLSCHGVSPRSIISSRTCLSLSVSMARQNPSYLYAINSPRSMRRLKGCTTNSSPS